MDQATEQTLIGRFQAGDQSAFGALSESRYRCILHVALQVLRNEEAALDVAQEVLLRAYEELPNWRGEARLATWFYRTTLNVCFEHLRAEERQRGLLAEAPCANAPVSPEHVALGNELRCAIDRAVKALPPRQRVVFALKQYEQMDFADIAALLDITYEGVRASYHKALLALRESLRELIPATRVPARRVERRRRHAASVQHVE